MTEQTLYDRLGGVFAIAAVVDHFSDAVVKNPVVGQQSDNPALRVWHTNNLGRLRLSLTTQSGAEADPLPAAVRAALEAGSFEELPGGRFRAAGHELGPDEVLVQRTGKEGWAIASEDGVTVALDTTLDDALRLEGRALDLIHHLNSMRRDARLELTDRIRVMLPPAEAEVVGAHGDAIKSEVLAVEIDVDDSLDEPQLAKVRT